MPKTGTATFPPALLGGKGLEISTIPRPRASDPAPRTQRRQGQDVSGQCKGACVYFFVVYLC